jgi:hypothetical protein
LVPPKTSSVTSGPGPGGAGAAAGGLGLAGQDFDRRLVASLQIAGDDGRPRSRGVAGLCGPHHLVFNFVYRSLARRKAFKRPTEHVSHADMSLGGQPRLQRVAKLLAYFDTRKRRVACILNDNFEALDLPDLAPLRRDGIHIQGRPKRRGRGRRLNACGLDCAEAALICHFDVVT